MALANTTTVHGSKQPSSPVFPVGIVTDLDNSYPAGGYPLSALGTTLDAVGAFPGAKIITSTPRLHYNGATLRWFQLVDVSGVATLKAFANTNGAKGAEEAAATDLSGHTGVEVDGLAQ